MYFRYNVQYSVVLDLIYNSKYFHQSKSLNQNISDVNSLLIDVFLFNFVLVYLSRGRTFICTSVLRRRLDGYNPVKFLRELTCRMRQNIWDKVVLSCLFLIPKGMLRILTIIGYFQ